MKVAKMESISNLEKAHSLVTPYAKDSARSWAVLVCAWSFYLYEYVLRVSPSVMTNHLMLDFGVTSTALGVLISFYYFSYVALQIPCGVIVDWLGPRKVITFSAFLCVIGSILFSQSTTLLGAQVGRFFIGAGSACAYLSCAKVGAEWFRPERFAVIAGMTMMMGTVGGIFGGRPFAILVNAYGWRLSMLIASLVGVAIALTAWLVVRDKPSTNKDLSETHGANESLLDGLKIVATNPQNWLIGLYGCMMYLPLSAFAELWGVPFLMQLYNINNETASIGSIMVFLGMATGCPLGAMLSNRYKSRIKIMSWSAVGTLMAFLVVFYVPNIPLNSMFVLLFVGGLFSGGQILYFAAAKEISPNETSGTTIGFTNCIIMLSGFIFQPLLGMLLDFAWDGKMTFDGTPEYSVLTYQISFSAVAVSLLFGWFIIQFVKETYPRN
jgi:sugar phosphate permease